MCTTRKSIKRAPKWFASCWRLTDPILIFYCHKLSPLNLLIIWKTYHNIVWDKKMDFNVSSRDVPQNTEKPPDSTTRYMRIQFAFGYSLNLYFICDDPCLLWWSMFSKSSRKWGLICFNFKDPSPRPGLQKKHLLVQSCVERKAFSDQN